MKYSPLPHTLLMIRPKAFGYNAETSVTNVFQKAQPEKSVHAQAVNEFDRMVDLLMSNDVDVIVIDDTDDPIKPDAIFPNNWISFHPDGKIVLYPMMAENRRSERRIDIVNTISEKFNVTSVLDFTAEELNEKFLEGTGSVVFDFANNIMYASYSQRTNRELLNRLARTLAYKLIDFNSVDEKGVAIYHTNVMMSVGKKFAVICLDAIHRDNEQELVLETLTSTGHKVIALSYAQMRAFAGNIFEVETRSGDSVVVMSKSAYDSLLPGQLNAIAAFSEILPVEIPTIEAVGGGGVRCMIAGIYLPKTGGESLE